MVLLKCSIYQTILLFHRKEINESIKALRDEDITRKNMESFYNDNSHNQYSDDITTMFNIYLV